MTNWRSIVGGVLVAGVYAAAPRGLCAQELFGPPPPTANEVAAPIRLPPIDDEVDEAHAEELPLEPLLDTDAVEGDLEDDDLESYEATDRRIRSSSSGGSPGMFGRGGSRSPIGFRSFWEPSQPVEGQSTDFEVVGQELRLAFPVWTEEPHVVLLSVGVGADLFDTAALFPTSGTEFPETLWDVGIGMNYIRKFDNGWTAGTGVNVGSAADRPFNQIRDVNAGVMAFLNIPREGDTAWNLFLFYSPLSEIPFPIPGVSYHWHASDTLEMNIGLPAQIIYLPTAQLKFEASYMLLHTIHAQATWTINDDWCAYAAFDWQNRAWFLHERVRDDERLFRYDQSLRIGVQRTVFDKFQFDVAAGYLFNRFYFLGEEYADRNEDRINIDSGAAFGVQAGLSF